MNGEFVLQRAWKRRRIKATDKVVFVSRPLGGGSGSSGKQVLGIVALIAASALALWAGPAIAGTLFGGSALAGGLITAGITVGASLLINALVAPKAGGQADSAQESTPQAFSLSAAGNSARALQTIPVSYGRLRKYCDFATLPWSDFIGDDQYLNVLLCEGSGRYDHEQVLLDDTILWDRVNGVNPDFDAQVAFYDPGQTVTLFPVNVTTATEVNGQQLPPGTGGQPVDNFPQPGPWVGGFIANSPGTLGRYPCSGFRIPGRLLPRRRGGQLSSRPVRVEGEYRPVDDAGAPIGGAGWSQLFDTLRRTTIPASRKNSVNKVGLPAPGRYEVRVRRYGSRPPISIPRSPASAAQMACLAATARVSAGQCELRERDHRRDPYSRNPDLAGVGPQVLGDLDPHLQGLERQCPRRAADPQSSVGVLRCRHQPGLRTKRAPGKIDFNAIVTLAAGADVTRRAVRLRISVAGSGSERVRYHPQGNQGASSLGR